MDFDTWNLTKWFVHIFLPEVSSVQGSGTDPSEPGTPLVHLIQDDVGVLPKLLESSFCLLVSLKFGEPPLPQPLVSLKHGPKERGMETSGLGSNVGIVSKGALFETQVLQLQTNSLGAEDEWA